MKHLPIALLLLAAALLHSSCNLPPIVNPVGPAGSSSGGAAGASLGGRLGAGGVAVTCAALCARPCTAGVAGQCQATCERVVAARLETLEELARGCR